MTTHESEIRALLARRAEAQQSKDIDRLMSFYADDAVYYDAVPPLRFTGTDEIRRNFLRWFDGYAGPISLETHDVTLAAGGGTAFAHMLHLDSGEREGGLQASIWVRESVCLRRTGGRWSITHEHVSIPVDPTTMTVWLPTGKDQPFSFGAAR
ncbi:nuclear transport factor 2 family protein [Streptomyces sp. G2]|uniref:YybH family protein n=1 Tax=Streptomyces TaxID=1883 RepID=UPI00202EADBB|nr:nuclear transport factor 2 family protein [Streptomyces sp. G2]MCM1948415.1 nuclear transport factor 2 family protein [Streptomyces sp. G2]